MNYLTQKWWGAAVLALLCFVPCAFANSNLTMTGAGNNVMAGVYVGPYTATVNGVANTPVICDDFADDSVIGHSWNFTANNFSTLGSALWGNQTNNYEAAAWLTLQMLSLNSKPDNALQVGYLSFAIWSLFDKGALWSIRMSRTKEHHPVQLWSSPNLYQSCKPSQGKPKHSYSPGIQTAVVRPGRKHPVQDHFRLPRSFDQIYAISDVALVVAVIASVR